MKRAISLLLMLALMPAASLSAQTVQLAEGTVLLAVVEDANGEGVRVRRLDNGGILELRWDQLSTVSSQAIKKRWDLAGDTQDEILVRADEVEYVIAGHRQTVIGKIVDQTPTEVIVQNRGVPYRIPRTDIRAVRTLDVPVGQIYTTDEWYAVRLARLSDPTKADQHMLMAEDLIKVRDYEHAAEHLAKARELGNTRDEAKLQRLEERLARYKDAAEERELLDEIIACRSRGTLSSFEKGVGLVAKFDETYPAGKLRNEFEREKERFEKARTAFYSQQVADYVRRSIRTLADKKVGETGITLQAARDYAENRMTDDLFARAAQKFRLEVEEIRSLWNLREKYRLGKRTEHFSYGVGSWVLGEAALLKNTEVQKAREKRQGGKKPAQGDRAQIEKIQRALRQALERRRAATQGGTQSREQTDEEWWSSSKRTERANWLRAYYAEFGGELVVTYATVSPCVACYGKGTVPEVGPDGKLVRRPCFLCHNTKWVRSFKAY